MKRIYPILAKCVDAFENLYDITADHRCKDLFGADIMPADDDSIAMVSRDSKTEI